MTHSSFVLFWYSKHEGDESTLKEIAYPEDRTEKYTLSVENLDYNLFMHTDKCEMESSKSSFWQGQLPL